MMDLILIWLCYIIIYGKKLVLGDVRICLCDKCIEKRLGKRIVKEDLIPNLPVNDLYIQMYLDL